MHAPRSWPASGQSVSVHYYDVALLSLAWYKLEVTLRARCAHSSARASSPALEMALVSVQRPERSASCSSHRRSSFHSSASSPASRSSAEAERIGARRVTSVAPHDEARSRIQRHPAIHHMAKRWVSRPDEHLHAGHQHHVARRWTVFSGTPTTASSLAGRELCDL